MPINWIDTWEIMGIVCLKGPKSNLCIYSDLHQYAHQYAHWDIVGGDAAATPDCDLPIGFLLYCIDESQIYRCFYNPVTNLAYTINGVPPLASEIGTAWIANERPWEPSGKLKDRIIQQIRELM